MKISDVKTCFKIADVTMQNKDNDKKLKFSYLEKIIDENKNELDLKILTKNVPRIYILVVDEIIKKIGGSDSNGGIKNTLEIYKNGGLNGQPSNRSVGIWWHLFQEVALNKKVEIYMKYEDNFMTEIKGLFKKQQKEASISFKHIEKLCLEDYYSVEKKYPDWNYQENNQKWPTEVDSIVIITKQNKGKTEKTGKKLNISKELFL